VTFKECHLVVLDPSKLIKPHQEIYLVDQFGLSFIYDSGKKLFEGLRSHPMDVLLLFLGDGANKEALETLCTLKEQNPDLPLIIATQEGTAELDKILSFSSMGYLPLEWDEDRLAGFLKTQGRMITCYALKASKERGLGIEERSVEEAIAHFFAQAKERLGVFEFRHEESKELDYSLMKRFIHTAYNNFIEIDPKIQGLKKLSEAKERFSEALGIQYRLQRRIGSSIAYNYEEIFLKSQPLYIDTLRALQQSIHKITLYQKEIGILSAQMDRIKLEQKGAGIEPESREDLERSFKNVNRRYIDRVHEVKRLQEELGALEKRREELWERDFDNFVRIFREEAGKYEKEANALVNRLAYRFDRILWIAARESRFVRGYFAQGMIEGVFSSKTYLDYYVKQLDKSLYSEFNHRLISYRQKMEEENAIRVALLGNVMEDLAQEGRQMEEIDSYIRVEVFTASTLERFFTKLQEGRFEIIVMEDVVGRSLFTQLHEQIQERIAPGLCAPKKVVIARHAKEPSRIRQKAMKLRFDGVLIVPVTREKIKNLLLSIA